MKAQPLGALLVLPIFLAVSGCATDPLAEAHLWTVEHCAQLGASTVRFPRPDGTVFATVPRSSCERLSRASRKIQAVASLSFSEIYLTDVDSLNAFTTKNKEGRPIAIVTLPLLVSLGNDESAMAGVLGHEIAHVVRGHDEGREEAQVGAKVTGELVARVIGTLIPGIGGFVGGAVGATLAQNTLYGSYTRPQEEEADDLGLKWMVAAGYDPRGMERLFELLDRKSGSPALASFSTHPESNDRAAKIRRFIASSDGRQTE